MSCVRVYALVAASVLCALAPSPGTAQSSAAEVRAERVLVTPPPQFRDSCRRYMWLCDNAVPSGTVLSDTEMLELASRINRRVNLMVAPVTDAENYGTADYWTLPTRLTGDCEDYVLLKYKMLIEAGIDGRNLAVAIALNRKGENHAVLVLHHASGDLVLDSETSRIELWNETGYRFLAMQSSDDRSAWEVVAKQPRSSNILAQR